MVKQKRRKSRNPRKNKEEKFFSELEIIGGFVVLIILIAFLVNLFWANPSNIGFCGDGECSKDERGFCKIDCDWCGDGYCQEGENCDSCLNDCGGCNAESFCGDGICNVGECDSACWKDCSFLECENGICEIEKGENCVNSPNDCKCIGGICNELTKECVYQSCGNKICEDYESYLNCPNDCEGVEYIPKDFSDVNYPIIFVHGHSMGDDDENSINSFREFQNKMEGESYINKGILLPSANKDKLSFGAWEKLSNPVSVRTTYYLGVYDERGDIIGKEDNQHITIYADRLSKVIDIFKYYTGKNKVIIIAHSMGGLVSREYIRKYGSESVDKLVTIGTPNHGIYGGIANNCESMFAIFGVGRGETSPECDDMRNINGFITNLNFGDETPGDIDYLTIKGKAKKGLVNVLIPYLPCDSYQEYHDEVVCDSSVPLEGAINEEIIGLEVSGVGTFHTYMIHPSKVPEVYKIVVDFL